MQEDARFAFVVPDAAPTRVFHVATTGKWAEEPHSLTLRRMWEAYATSAGVKGKADGPQLMRGLAELAAVQGKTATPSTVVALSTEAAFQDRVTAGVLQYVSSDEDERNRLIDYASRQAVEDDEDSKPSGFPVALLATLPPTAAAKKGEDEPPPEVFDPFKLL